MSSVKRGKEDKEVTSRMPPSRDAQRFLTFLWNPKAKTVLGRSWVSWAKIGFFYIVFYSFLAAFFSILMAIFYQTINYDLPKYTGQDSVLVNPGLSFRPRAPGKDDLRPTITYDHSAPTTSSYVASVREYLKAYDTRPSNAKDCVPGDGYRQEGDDLCYFNVDALNTTCAPDNLWGYNTTSPCLLMKLNKILFWTPEPLSSLDGLPEGLQHHINALENPEEALKQNAWVWCESKDVDLEQQSPGLPLHFFPYRKQDGYLAPFAPVRFLNLQIDQKVKAKCRVWAGNIKHTSYLRRTYEVNIHITAH